MTKKDLFRLIIKIFGLYLFIKAVFSILPNNLYSVIIAIDLLEIIPNIIIFVLMLLFFMFLFYKTDKIINWLNLDKGFDNDIINFQNFNSENILNLAIIIIGGILLIENIPVFLTYTLSSLKLIIQTNFESGNIIKPMDLQNYNYVYWITSFLNIIFGYFLLTNYNSISNIIKKKNKQNYY